MRLLVGTSMLTLCTPGNRPPNSQVLSDLDLVCGVHCLRSLLFLGCHFLLVRNGVLLVTVGIGVKKHGVASPTNHLLVGGITNFLSPFGLTAFASYVAGAPTFYAALALRPVLLFLRWNQRHASPIGQHSPLFGIRSALYCLFCFYASLD